MGPRLKPIQVSPDGISSLLCVNSTTQLGVIFKLGEGVLNSIAHIAYKDVKIAFVPALIPEECHSPLISTWMSGTCEMPFFFCDGLQMFVTLLHRVLK